METSKFYFGDRVIISGEAYWAHRVIGTISTPPMPKQNEVKYQAGGEAWHRFVQTPKGSVKFYWVEFDKPQFDADGDGPYKSAEIIDTALQHLIE